MWAVYSIIANILSRRLGPGNVLALGGMYILATWWNLYSLVGAMYISHTDDTLILSESHARWLWYLFRTLLWLETIFRLANSN